jgi:hypothetical protein
MVGTVCIGSAICGIIADMTRVLTGLAAWLAGTALAVGLAWFGANMVVRDAGVSPGVQVINADPSPAAAVLPTPPAPPTPPATGTPAASDPARSTAASSPSPSASAKPTAKPTAIAKPSAANTATATNTATAGSVHSYTLTGGRVALLFNGDSVTLMTAVPDSGYSVQTWSGTDWLRVDFSSGAQVSSLIASWYEHTPTVTVTN